MNRKHAIFVAILMAVLPLFALAQDEDEKGRDWGGYTVRQSIELGGHIADAEGNQQMYSTFVNLATGPRILGQELSMQSKNHAGVLFDNLYVTSFGFGGDPENLARLRISKNKWYNFVGLYRRDKNFFDYNLFANPLNLNAGVTRCAAGCLNAVNPQTLPWFTDSPHLQATTRNMGDFMLTVLPESAISFRLGYARNDTNGTMDTSFGTPFTTLMTEKSGWRSDRYQFGADLKLLPRTTLSLDAFFEHDKNDLAFRNVPGFVLGGSGLPVDIGLNFLPNTTNPACITSAGPPPVLALNTSCTGATLGFTKSGNFRTDIPTGQLSFASNYFRNLDITASGMYSSSSFDLRNFSEFNYGTAPTLLTGPASNSRVSRNADLGVTYHLSKRWSISDKFRWMNWSQPGALDLTTFTCNHAAGSTLLSAFVSPCGQGPASALLTLINGVNPGATVTGTPTGTFEAISTYRTLIGERSYFNTVKLNWQQGRYFSAYAGYRYGRRELNEGTALSAAGAPLSPPTNIYIQNTTTISSACQVNPAAAGCSTSTLPSLSTAPGIDTEEINQHTLLVGTVLRPTEGWRINADVELLSADNAFTNYSPRNQQRVRLYSKIKVNPWMSLNGGVHLVTTRNSFARSEVLEGTTTPLFPSAGALGSSFYGHKDHWRYYTLGIGFNPNSKVTLDIGWTLLDQHIESAACMPLAASSFAPAGSTPAGLTAPTAAFTCATGTNVWALLLNYGENTNSGYTNITYRPVKHVELTFGYEVTGDNGRTNWLRPDTGASLQVFGDAFGNVPPLTGNSLTCTSGSTQVKSAAGANLGCAFAGPFADQPLGPQAINWHKAHLGVAFDVAKGVQFKGLWNYYDYNSKDEVPSLSLLQVTTPRDFHANVGTISLKYTF